MGDYLDLHGQRVHYLEQGAGEPVFLLHGGLTSAWSWGAQMPALAEAYRVIAPERRGHGRTPDVPGPYTTQIMTAETAAVIEALAGGPAHIIGWSDGAYVAAYLAITRPDLVRRLVLIGQAYERAGETNGVREFMYADGIAEWFRADYAAESPDGPQHFDEVFGKVMALWRNPLELPLNQMARIVAPTLVMQGDDDGVRLEYSAALVKALPHAQFAVIPGAGHGAPMQRPELVNRIILEFLAPDQPPRMIPLGALRDA